MQQVDNHQTVHVEEQNQTANRDNSGEKQSSATDSKIGACLICPRIHNSECEDNWLQPRKTNNNVLKVKTIIQITNNTLFNNNLY